MVDRMGFEPTTSALRTPAEDVELAVHRRGRDRAAPRGDALLDGNPRNAVELQPSEVRRQAVERGALAGVPALVRRDIDAVPAGEHPEGDRLARRGQVVAAACRRRHARVEGILGERPLVRRWATVGASTGIRVLSRRPFTQSQKYGESRRVKTPISDSPSDRAVGPSDYPTAVAVATRSGNGRRTAR